MIYVLSTILIIMTVLIVLTIYAIVRMIKEGLIIIRIDTNTPTFITDEMDDIINEKVL